MKELKYSWCDRHCCRCIGRAGAGKIIRSLVIASNILYWFAGCAILSVAIWLRFVDVGTKNYFSTFHPVDTALYVVLVASILFLLSSFVGTCSANTKNELLITLYITVLFVVAIAEVVSLVVYSSSHVEIERDFSRWYKGHFERYHEENVLHKDVVNHVQSKMKCCGMSGPRDYFIVFGNSSIPNSCIIQIEIAENIYRPDVYKAGCMEKLSDLITWLLKGWPLPFVATIILLLQVAGIITSALFLQHIVYRKNFNYDDDEGESSGLIDSKSKGKLSYSTNHPAKQLAKMSTEDLPRPKLFRVMKSPIDETYGFDLAFDEDRNCYVITDVQLDSNAEYAGLTKGSQVIELNGLLLQGVDQDEVYEKMETMTNELLLVTVDEKTESVYRANKVAVNLRNLEGVTSGTIEYRPRFCNLKKGNKGFGFHLLYLEDRKGEYIEEIAAGSPAHEAGLSVGDRIIDVNGVNIEREKSSDVVKRIRMSGDAISLLVVDPKTDGFYRKKGVTLSASLALDYYNGRMSSGAVATPLIEKRQTNRNIKPRYCRLVKSEQEDFGLYVVIDNNRIGQVIRWVDCGGPADRAGLRIGDRIIEVNGHSVEYETHQRLISCISINKTLSHFIVVDEDYDRVYKRNKPRLCRIFKESGSLGFCICYFKNKDGHYIEEVQTGGPAERAGLKVNDRIIQIDGINVEKDSQENILSRLRSCETNVVLLVIDSRSNKHYRRIVKFKSEGMKDVDYDTVSFPDEPLFLLEEEDAVTLPSDQISLGTNDSISLRGTQSRGSTAVTLMGDQASINTERQGYRECTVRMSRQEKQGFSLTVDRDRNGLVVKQMMKGGPGDRSGLRDGDRIMTVNGQKINNLNHDEVIEKIQQSGRRFTLTVLDEISDDVAMKHRPYLFRITKDDGGYGFYLWHDDNGHYVEEVTTGSPADQSGMRSGDRIIEVNGVNVEEETHEEVFYRVKASMNTVTLLAVDQKTFKLYKKNKIPVSILKAETNFSDDLTKNSGEGEAKNKATKTMTQDIELYREKGGDFGFNLAYSNSFMGDSNTGSHVVHWVEIGGPASEAGLRDGDKIVSVNGVDVTNEDQDQVIPRIYKVGKQDVILTIEYEEEQDAYVPHTVAIRKIDNSFGFHLWFDQNGHYIEDVTIGSAADTAGLKISDRVLKVAGKDVEESSHADVVALVRQSGDKVCLEVLGIQNDDVGDFSAPTVCTLIKERGTFGFTLSQDDRGFHFDYVANFSSAEKMGISVGDRLLEVGGETVSDLDYGAVVSAIRRSGATVTLTVMSSSNRTIGSNRAGDTLKFDSYSNQIFNELIGKDKIDFVVENKGFGLFGRSEDRTDDTGTNVSKSSGKDNPVFAGDTEDNLLFSGLDDILSKDIQGRFLDEKLLPEASAQSTMKRRKPGRNIYSRKRRFAIPRPGNDRRKRSLQDIEQKLGNNWKKTRSPSDSERVTYKKESTDQSKKDKRFRFVASRSALRHKWNFEEGDSRRPGEIKSVLVEESIKEEDEGKVSSHYSDNDGMEVDESNVKYLDTFDDKAAESTNEMLGQPEEIDSGAQPDSVSTDTSDETSNNSRDVAEEQISPIKTSSKNSIKQQDESEESMHQIRDSDDQENEVSASKSSSQNSMLKRDKSEESLHQIRDNVDQKNEVSISKTHSQNSMTEQGGSEESLQQIHDNGDQENGRAQMRLADTFEEVEQVSQNHEVAQDSQKHVEAIETETTFADEIKDKEDEIMV